TTTIGFKPKALSFITRVTPPAARYIEFDIPKRSGGTRRICSPNKQLSLLQSRLAELLNECEVEIAQQRSIKRHVAHGFRKGYSILTNADVHRGRRYVLNIDLTDFFGTIHFGRVKGFFENSLDFQLKAEPALVLAQIACHEGKLPQGSPCSPVISNLIANILDMRLVALSKRHGCSYTRYADDLSFSTSKLIFSDALATPSEANKSIWQAGPDLIAAVHSAGFKINPLKTRVQLSRSRQDVTGVVVNRQLNTPVEYRRTLRSMVHRLCSTGEYLLQETDPATGKQKVGTPAQLQGMLGFAYQVERWRSRNDEPASGAQTAMERLLKRFLYYKEFASPMLTAIVFEGKTDSVYLREAIRRSGTAFPMLSKGAGTTFELKVKLHRESKIMKKLFGLTSGGDPLKNFIKCYRWEFSRIDGPKGQNPVIVLMDNDDGFTGTKAMLFNVYKISISSGQQFIHVWENLYILLSSPFGGAKHCIEDCFTASVLAVKLGIKEFSKTNDFDPNIYYGKEWLAEKVVKPNSATIDFSGFGNLLSALQDVILHHSATMLSARAANTGVPSLPMPLPIPGGPAP
ncbi:MAG: RNA-directed DNA polymerase, partial [Cytophagaceae bacterium]